MVKVSQTLIVLAVVFLPTATVAQVSTKTTVPAENRCQRVADNILRQSKVYEASKARHLDVLEQTRQRLVGIIGRADARGYDVSQLQSNQAELARQTALIQADYQTLQSSLISVSTTCADPTKVVASQGALQALRSDITTTRTWIMDTLRADLDNLKTKVKA